MHARTHVAVAVKLLIVRAGRASALALALALASQASNCLFTPDRDRTCLCRSPPHVARRRSTSPALRAAPARILEKTRPLSARFSLFREARNTQRERARAPARPLAVAVVSLKKTQEPHGPPGL